MAWAYHYEATDLERARRCVQQLIKLSQTLDTQEKLILQVAEKILQQQCDKTRKLAIHYWNRYEEEKKL